jgi:hypothetical protein
MKLPAKTPAVIVTPHADPLATPVESTSTKCARLLTSHVGVPTVQSHPQFAACTTDSTDSADSAANTNANRDGFIVDFIVARFTLFDRTRKRNDGAVQVNNVSCAHRRDRLLTPTTR